MAIAIEIDADEGFTNFDLMRDGVKVSIRLDTVGSWHVLNQLAEEDDEQKRNDEWKKHLVDNGFPESLPIASAIKIADHIVTEAEKFFATRSPRVAPTEEPLSEK
jgi:hypothetical protein